MVKSIKDLIQPYGGEYAIKSTRQGGKPPAFSVSPVSRTKTGINVTISNEGKLLAGQPSEGRVTVTTANSAKTTDERLAEEAEKERIENEAKERSLRATQMELDQLKDQIMAGNGKNTKSMDEARAITIAFRLMAGDHVPPGDEKFLAEYNMKLYGQAKTIGIMVQNQDPKDYDSILEEEEGGEAGGGAGEPSVPADPSLADTSSADQSSPSTNSSSEGSPSLE